MLHYLHTIAKINSHTESTSACSITEITCSYCQRTHVSSDTQRQWDSSLTSQKGFWGNGILSVWPWRNKAHILARSSLLLETYVQYLKYSSLGGGQPLIHVYLCRFSLR